MTFSNIIALFSSMAIAAISFRFPHVTSHLALNPWIQKIGGMRTIGIVCGTLVFAAIALHGDPAHAQLFNKAEQQTNSIFGQYLDASIVKFMFGLLRVVV
jgi:hypothetical protein